MSEKIIFDYFYNHETDMVCFYRIPKFLVTNDRFSKMKTEYVLGCMKDNTTKIRNIRKYLLAALFNAPTTMSGYFAAEVSHDMAEYAVKQMEG